MLSGGCFLQCPRSIPLNALNCCLEYSGCRIDKLDAVVFYDKPLLKFVRLLETYYAFAPKGLFQFLIAIPVWLKERILKNMIRTNRACSILLYVIITVCCKAKKLKVTQKYCV